MTLLALTVPPLYIIDANIFIEAAMRYYAFDLVPKFWDEPFMDTFAMLRALGIRL